MFWNFKKKPVVITVHGFGLKTHHEMDDLASFLKTHGFEVVQFDLYDPTKADDANRNDWIKRAEQIVSEAIAKNKDVYLLGFSMGGVIASYLATIYPVKALILVAPAFQYINLQMAMNIAKKVFSNTSVPSPSKAQTKTFTEIVNQYRESISEVDQPVLMIHGTKDEVIDPSSSSNAFKKIKHDQKQLVFIEGAPHRLLYTEAYEKIAFWIILTMLEGKLL